MTITFKVDNIEVVIKGKQMEATIVKVELNNSLKTRLKDIKKVLNIKTSAQAVRHLIVLFPFISAQSIVNSTKKDMFSQLKSGRGKSGAANKH